MGTKSAELPKQRIGQTLKQNRKANSMTLIQSSLANPYSAAMLAKCINEPTSILKFQKLLKRHQVADQVDRQLFGALCQNYSSSEETFSDLWKIDPKIKQVHLDRFQQIVDSQFSPLEDDIPKVAKLVLEEWQWLLLVSGAAKIIESAKAREQSAMDALDEFEAGALSIKLALEKPFETQEEMLFKLTTALEERSQNDSRVSSGFEVLDWLINGGFKKGEFIVIGSMTGQGKSMLASQLMLAMTRKNMRVAMFGLEMDSLEYGERMIANIASVLGYRGLTLSNLARPNSRNGLNMDKLGELYDILRQQQIIYATSKEVTVSDLKVLFEIAVKEHKVDAIFLDHTLLVDSGKKEQREMIEEICKFMKNFATDNGIICSAVTQMNRDTNIFDPKVSDLSGGRSIEHQATTLLTIGKQLKENQAQKIGENYHDDGTRKITVLKSRSAKSGTYFLAKFRGYDAMFDELYPDNWDDIKDHDPNDNKLVYDLY